MVWENTLFFKKNNIVSFFRKKRLTLGVPQRNLCQ